MSKSNINKVTGCIQTKGGRSNYYIVLSSYDDAGKRVRKWVYTDGKKQSVRFFPS